MKIVFIFIGILSLLSCSERVAGGGTDYPNSFDAVVVHEDGSVVVDAEVRAIHKKSWLKKVAANQSVVSERSFTDSLGRFEFNFSQKGNYNLEVVTDSLGVIVYNCKELKGDTIILTPYSSLEVVVNNDKEVANQYFLGGTSFGSYLDNQNKLKFTSIPQGVHSITTISNSLSYYVENVNVSASFTTDTLTLQRDTLLVEDFSRGFPYTLLGSFTDGLWYYYADKLPPYNGNSDVIWSTITGAAAWNKGTSLSGKLFLKEGFQRPFAGIGFLLGSRSSDYDLSNLKTFSFMAKGKGTVRVTFGNYFLDTLDGSNAQFGTTIKLKGSWEKITLSMDSLALAPNSKAAKMGVTWKQVSTAIKKIEFGVYSDNTTVGDTVELFLDELKMPNISLEVFK